MSAPGFSSRAIAGRAAEDGKEPWLSHLRWLQAHRAKSGPRFSASNNVSADAVMEAAMICQFCKQDVDEPCHNAEEMQQRAAAHVHNCESALKSTVVWRT